MIPNPKDSLQAKVLYHITMRQPYTYDSIRYMQRRHRTDTIVRTHKVQSLLRKGDNFNVVQLEAERQRISTLLARTTAFIISARNIFLIRPDTSRVPGKVWLRIIPSPGMPREALRPWTLGNITVALNGYNNEAPTDTIQYEGLTILYEGKLRVRPAVLRRRFNSRRATVMPIPRKRRHRRRSPAWVFLNTQRCNTRRQTPRDSAGRWICA